MATYALGFDADDTLWHNETLFAQMHARYAAMLAQHHDAETVARTLFATEMRNLELYGYGIKGFMLSAIETAIELTEGRIPAQELRELIALGHEMLRHPVELLAGVAETLTAVAALPAPPRLLLITKGDLRDQERKLARSGLAHHFAHIEILSDKTPAAYAALLRRHELAAERFFMVGNSLRSDILPVLALGGAAAFIPYPLQWAHEHAEPPVVPGRFFTLAAIREVPAAFAAWREGGGDEL